MLSARVAEREKHIYGNLTESQIDNPSVATSCATFPCTGTARSGICRSPKASPVQGEVDCEARRWGCLKASISPTFSAMKKDDLHIGARIRVSLYGGYTPSLPLALSYNPSVTASRATFPYTGTAKLGLSKPLRSNFAIIKRSESASLLVSERVQIAPRAQISDLQMGNARKPIRLSARKEYRQRSIAEFIEAKISPLRLPHPYFHMSFREPF